jgi:hypothetical protein
MKNALKFLGIIALVAVIGFSFAACEGPVGPQGDTGTTGPQRTPGADGGMIPYIPAESGLLGTIWEINGSNPIQSLIISDDGYTFSREGTNSSTFQLLSYWKGTDSTATIQIISSGGTIWRIGINGNTLTWGNDTLTKTNATALPSIPAESGLRGTVWNRTNGNNPINKITFNSVGDATTSTLAGTDYNNPVIMYWKTTDDSHVVKVTMDSGTVN